MNAATSPQATMTKALALRIFIPFALGYFLSYLFRVVNAVIAPELVEDIGLDASHLGLLTSVYFLTFAAFQLPLGILLDRFGPRKTEAILLLFAGLGAFVFSQAESSTGLLIGRALIGFGVSACLMAAFKAFVDWFPSERLPLINGLQMAAGGLGALAATTPVEAALQITDWRGVFMVLAVMSVVIAALVLAMVPKRDDPPHDTHFKEQLQGLKSVFVSPVFWSIAPWTVASQATFLAIQGLWAGPWLRDVAGLPRGEVATVLFIVAASMVAGFILMGTIAARLSSLGARPVYVAAFGMAMFMIFQVFVILEWTGAELGLGVFVLWALFGFFGTTGIIPYAALSQAFHSALAGRVNTSINLLVFVAAFAVQWGMGGIINAYSEAGASGYAPQGYQMAFLAMLGIQAIAAAWFVISAMRGNRP
ncbi:MAG: MFS transporter [Rhodospirillales bacterium]|nr:MFS transporter [Rhodospirillales bacterium]MCW8952268.1 MFS transporter [Rhodospirillales bacterium]MCW8970920.1 MFS transporter [Rhodospirillales bacterium]MCW9002464.1 MFS transporter [Rhodospirillales bacterium]MCW9040845.1 MFS transporter [Rhodospirillales bacterium]